MLLRLAGLIWSASDFAHPVTTAAGLLLAQYLAQCRVRHLVDLAAGLFLCSVSAQYEIFSKRLVPEVVSFLSHHIPSLFLGYSLQDDAEEMTGTSLSGPVGASPERPATQPDILQILCEGTIAKTAREQMCYNALVLSAETYGRQTSLPSFVECFSPLARSLESVSSELSSSPLKVS